jgi:2-haloacid dehalogenase
MSLHMTRRRFALAASSAGSFLFSGPMSLLAKIAGAAPQSEPSGPVKPKVLAFDVNQTLLDVNALRPHFARVFGDGGVLREWFALLLQYSLVVTVADSYVDFGSVGRAVLEMLANTRGVKLSSEDAAQISQSMLALPAHPEVAENLKRLKTAGFRMVTLTNSALPAVKAQLQNAGISQYFDESISVDSVRRFKPDLEVYRSAATHLGAQPREILLVAAHAWDVFGAAKAGWQTAFVARDGIAPLPLGAKPTISGSDLKAVADAILK